MPLICYYIVLEKVGLQIIDVKVYIKKNSI